MRVRDSLGGWGLKEGDRARWVGVVSSRKGGGLFGGWGLRKGREDLLRGWGCWGGGWEVGRWDLRERGGDSGRGLWAPGLARGPAAHHAAPCPAKAPPARQHHLCPREVWGTSRPVITAVSQGSWLPYSSAPRPPRGTSLGSGCWGCCTPGSSAAGLVTNRAGGSAARLLPG